MKINCWCINIAISWLTHKHDVYAQVGPAVDQAMRMGPIAFCQFIHSVFSLFLQHSGRGWLSFLNCLGTRYATHMLPSFAHVLAQM